MKWVVSGVLALAVSLGGLTFLHEVRAVGPLDVLVLAMVGVLVAWLALDLIGRRPFDAMWARLLIVAAATTFGLFVGRATAWIAYAVAAAALLAMYLRSRRQQRAGPQAAHEREQVWAR